MNQEERNQKKKKREIKWIDIHTTTIQIYIYIAKSITHTTRKQKKKNVFFFFVREKNYIAQFSNNRSCLVRLFVLSI
jgi:hypothetical protein